MQSQRRLSEYLSRRYGVRLSPAAAAADDQVMQRQFFEILVGQIRQDNKADIVLGKALRVLPETELLKPINDLLHRGSAGIVGLHSARAGNFIREVRNVVGGYSYEQAGGTDVPNGCGAAFKESFA
jgi:hypothetical protein